MNRAKINPRMMEWARLYAGFSNCYEESLPIEIKIGKWRYLSNMESVKKCQPKI